MRDPHADRKLSCGDSSSIIACFYIMNSHLIFVAKVLRHGNSDHYFSSTDPGIFCLRVHTSQHRNPHLKSYENFKPVLQRERETEILKKMSQFLSRNSKDEHPSLSLNY